MLSETNLKNTLKSIITCYKKLIDDNCIEAKSKSNSLKVDDYTNIEVESNQKLYNSIIKFLLKLPNKELFLKV